MNKRPSRLLPPLAFFGGLLLYLILGKVCFATLAGYAHGLATVYRVLSVAAVVAFLISFVTLPDSLDSSRRFLGLLFLIGSVLGALFSNSWWDGYRGHAAILRTAVRKNLALKCGDRILNSDQVKSIETYEGTAPWNGACVVMTTLGEILDCEMCEVRRIVEGRKLHRARTEARLFKSVKAVKCLGKVSLDFHVRISEGECLIDTAEHTYSCRDCIPLH